MHCEKGDIGHLEKKCLHELLLMMGVHGFGGDQGILCDDVLG